MFLTLLKLYLKFCNYLILADRFTCVEQPSLEPQPFLSAKHKELMSFKTLPGLPTHELLVTSGIPQVNLQKLCLPFWIYLSGNVPSVVSLAQRQRQQKSHSYRGAQS